MAQEYKAPGDVDAVTRFGVIEVDWPRTLGLYIGLGVAVATEVMAPPLAAFIAAYPLLKLMNQRRAPKAVQFAAQLIEGAAEPFGGGDEGVMRVIPDARPHSTIKSRHSSPTDATRPPRTERAAAEPPGAASPDSAQRPPSGPTAAKQVQTS